jgi:hypothetical protein
MKLPETYLFLDPGMREFGNRGPLLIGRLRFFRLHLFQEGGDHGIINGPDKGTSFRLGAALLLVGARGAILGGGPIDVLGLPDPRFLPLRPQGLPLGAGVRIVFLVIGKVFRPEGRVYLSDI